MEMSPFYAEVDRQLDSVTLRLSQSERLSNRGPIEHY